MRAETHQSRCRSHRPAEQRRLDRLIARRQPMTRDVLDSGAGADHADGATAFR
jgi:hypothetical protein